MSTQSANERGYAASLIRLSEWISVRLIRHRVMLLVFFAVITAALGYHAASLRMDPGFSKSIPLSHEFMRIYAKYSPTFGGANMLVVALRQKGDEDIFNKEFLNDLEQATQDVLFIKGVDRGSAMSLFTPNVSFVAVNEQGFVGYRIIPSDFTPTPEGIEGVRYALLQSEYMGRLVSHDFKGALIRAELVDKDPATGEPLDYRDVAKTLEKIRAKYTSDRVDVQIIGFAKFVDDVVSGALGVILFFGIAVLITAVMLYFYSGSFQITLLALLVAVVAVIWQLGLVHMLGYGIDPLSILVPFLILAIAVSHAIQMTNTWKLEVLAGASSSQAAIASFNKLFVPGTTALVANAVGFAVIMVINIAIIRELGVTASIGVAVMIVTNKFLLPVLLSYASLSPRRIATINARAEGKDDLIWKGLSIFATRSWGAGAIGVASVALAFGLWKGHGLVIGDSEAGAPELRAESQYNEDIRSIIGNFTVGIDELTVIAELPNNGCVNFPAMSAVDRFVWHMQNVPGVQAVTAVTLVMKGRVVGNNEGYLKFYGMPREERGLGSSLRGIELGQKLFNDSCNALPVRVFLQDHKAETLTRAVQAAQAFEASNAGKGEVHFRLAAGSAGVMAATNEAVAAAELTMLLALFAAVGLLCFLTFLSWRAAVCVLLPLALVSMLANAVMVMLNIGLKVSTLPVVALGVGVGVDYGIYLFARTQSQLRLGLNLRDAYYQALRQTGTAVVFTASTMTIGVATWYYSALKFQADMGVLLAYMFFVNMLGAIILLPALAAWLIDPEAERRRKVAFPH